MSEPYVAAYHLRPGQKIQTNDGWFLRICSVKRTPKRVELTTLNVYGEEMKVRYAPQTKVFLDLDARR